MVLIITLLGPAPGVQKIFVHHFFSKIFFFENIFVFLTHLQSKTENFEVTSSFAFFLKISELFSNRKIPTTADVATQNVCVHATFTILN